MKRRPDTSFQHFLNSSRPLAFFAPFAFFAVNKHVKPNIEYSMSRETQKIDKIEALYEL